MERQIITVDISPQKGIVPRLKVSQGDIGRPLGVNIIQDGVALDCSAYTADLYVLKSDGNYFVSNVTIDSTETNLIKWDTAEQETIVSGECAAQIRIMKGSDDIGTARFVEYVEASPGFSGAGSESAVESIKEYVRQAAASAETASSAATSASTSATTATGAASSATSSATAAAGSASSAHTDAETASQAAQTAQDVAASIPADYTQLSEDVTGLKSAIVNKADTDGTYPELTAGTAEQLLSDDAIVNTTSYLFRPTGDSTQVGNREMVKKIVGGTVAWNQLIDKCVAGETPPLKNVYWENSSDRAHFHFYTNEGQTANGADFKIIKQWESFPANRVLLLKANGNESAFIELAESGGGPTITTQNSIGSVLRTVGSGKTCFLRARWVNNASFDLDTDINIFDLTTMFGSTIADYVYGLETATPGAGVAWFRKYFPNDYYPYNPGELISVSGLQGHDTVGFNQWDEETVSSGYFNTAGLWVSANTNLSSKNAIPVQPNTIYYLKAPANIYIHFFKTAVPSEANSPDEYISRSNFIHDTTFTTPPNCHAIHFNVTSVYGTTYNHDICINLSHSGTRNGEYEPYEKHSYPLDPSLTLRGIPKLDANNKLYYDGDTYAGDGTVTRRYGVVDLGTLTWTYQDGTEAYGYKYFQGSLVDDKKLLSTNFICSKYVNNLGARGSLADKQISLNNTTYGNTFCVRDDSFTSLSDFQTAMSGVYLVYELATPATEQADPYQEIQICNSWGTEEFVTDSIVPVGHETSYPANLVEKLDGLPWNFSTLIAPTETSTTASKAYTVGSYLIYQNTLYKVTSAIASGGTITPGTNVTATTIMAELTALA